MTLLVDKIESGNQKIAWYTNMLSFLKRTMITMKIAKGIK